jgi:hypothetical protein
LQNCNLNRIDSKRTRDSAKLNSNSNYRDITLCHEIWSSN